MLEGDPIALFISVIVIPAAVAMAIVTSSAQRRILALSLILLVSGKLWRVRGVVDVHVEPWLASHLGSHNLPVLYAAIVVVAGYCGVAYAMVPHRVFWRWVLPPALLGCVITDVAFRRSYGAEFAPYLSAGGLTTVSQALAWAPPLLIVLGASAAFIPPAARAWREARSNAPARIAAAGVLILGVLGAGYFLAKAGYLLVSTINDSAGSLPLLKTAGLVTLPLAFLALAVAVFAPPLMRVLGRVWRFVRLWSTRRDPQAGRHLPLTTVADLWGLASDPVAAHMALVGAYDEVILLDGESVDEERR